MSIYKQSAWIKISYLYEKLNILDVREGKYLTMNPIAQVIWEALLGSGNETEALNIVYEQVEGDKYQIRESFEVFKKRLLNEGYIEKVG